MHLGTYIHLNADHQDTATHFRIAAEFEVDNGKEHTEALFNNGRMPLAVPPMVIQTGRAAQNRYAEEPWHNPMRPQSSLMAQSAISSPEARSEASGRGNICDIHEDSYRRRWVSQLDQLLGPLRLCDMPHPLMSLQYFKPARISTWSWTSWTWIQNRDPKLVVRAGAVDFVLA